MLLDLDGEVRRFVLERRDFLKAGEILGRVAAYGCLVGELVAATDRPFREGPVLR